MDQLAPHILRKRVLIDGTFQGDLTGKHLRNFLVSLSDLLGMTITDGPHVKDKAGDVNPIHKGFELRMDWAESGVGLYTWKDERFFHRCVYMQRISYADTIEFCQ